MTMVISRNHDTKTKCFNGLCTKYKEVFVKHEQAPTAPKLEGVWVFVDFKYIFYENRYFWPILQLPAGFFDRNGQKAHLRTKTFHLSL